MDAADDQIKVTAVCQRSGRRHIPVGLTDLDAPQHLQFALPVLLHLCKLPCPLCFPLVKIGVAFPLGAIVKMVGDRHCRQSPVPGSLTQLADVAAGVGGIPAMGMTIHQMYHFDLQKHFIKVLYHTCLHISIGKTANYTAGGVILCF